MGAFYPASNTVLATFEGWELTVDILQLPVEISYQKCSLIQFLGDVEVLEVSLINCRL